MKGNNGWGNGEDGTNPGSGHGNSSQVLTKMNDPSVDDLAKVLKFGGR
jgi:hypothetical protein